MGYFEGTDEADNLYGNDEDDSLYGLGGDDTLDGGGGNDYLDGGTGNDTLIGGAGSDYYIVDSVADIIEETGAVDEWDTVVSSVSWTLGANLEGLVLSGGYWDSTIEQWVIPAIDGTGNDLDNSLSGNDGNNVLDGGAGNDWLYGNGGDDTLNGGTGDDYLSGDYGNDSLSGGDGNDQLDGGMGNDTLIGGVGNDWYFVDSADDVIEESGAVDEWDTVQSSVSWTLGENLEGLYLAGGYWDSTIGQWVTPAINGTGNGLDNMLSGNDADNVLEGGAGNDALYGTYGNDTLNGGAGDDILVGGDGSDTYLFDLGSGSDTISQQNWDAPGVAVDRIVFGAGVAPEDVVVGVNGTSLVLTIAGSPDDSLTIQNYFSGDEYKIQQIAFTDNDTVWDAAAIQTLVSTPTEGDNYIVGTDNSEKIDGQGGNDTILGGLGDDELIGGTGNDALYGEAGRDSLTGGAGNDYLDGGAGSDTLVGGVGYDQYVVDSANDVIEETGADNAWDSVTSSVSWTLGANLESLSLTGGYWDEAAQQWVENAIDGTGNELNNQLYGNGADNILDGAAGNDYIVGYSGNDTLNGGTGNDELYGGNGNDTLDGGAGNDYLNGGDGSDTYLFGLGSGQDQIYNYTWDLSAGAVDRIVFGAGVAPEDVVVGVNGTSLVLTIAGSPDDSLTIENYFSGDGYKIQRIEFTDSATVWDTAAIQTLVLTPTEGDNYIVGTDNSEKIDGLGGNDTILGGLGDDELIGGTGNDALYGEAGNDSLTGGAGNDHLDGGTGNDTLIGGEGSDQYVVDSAEDVILEEGTSSGWDGVTSSVSWTLGANLEGLSLSGQYWDSTAEQWVTPAINGTGNELDNTLSGNEADNILDGSDGYDTLYGHDGNDTLNGGAGNDYLSGNNGNDFLNGGSGSDYMIGGDGSDTYLFGLGSGQDQIYNYTWDLTAGDTDRIVFGAGVAPGDVVVGANGNNLVLTIAGSPDDRLTVEDYFSGDEYIIQQIAFTDGNSTVWDAAAIQALVATPSEGDNYIVGTENTDNINGLGGNDTILGKSGDDQLIGGTGNDSLYGEAGDDTLTGGDGSDTLDGGTGNDTLIGGAGSDQYFVDSVDDVIQEDGSSSNWDAVTSTVSWTLGANLEGLSLAGSHWDEATQQWVENAINGTGNELNNQLSGNGADNVLEGGAGYDSLYGNAGDDTLNGGAGDDYLSGGDGSDTYLFGLGSGQDQISNYTWSLAAGDSDRIVFGAGVAPDEVVVGASGNSLVLTIAGSPNDRLTVENYFSSDNYKIQQIEFADSTVWDAATIHALVSTPNNGDNYLVGTDDNETIDGFGGNDTILGKSGDDQLIGGTGNDSLYGDAGNDNLTGGDGNDQLDGGTGNDTLIGGTGSDQYVVDSVDDVIQEEGSLSDMDSVTSSVSWILGANLENLSLSYSWDATAQQWVANAIDGTGNELDNGLSGNGADNILDGGDGNDWMDAQSGNDTLNGGSGNDTLYGSDGNDTLNGGSGNDELIGGDGSDTYLFAPGFGNDWISNYSWNDVTGVVDRIVFNAGLTPENIVVGVDGDDLVLTVSGSPGDKLTVYGYFTTDENQNPQIEFATDNTVWHPSDILSRVSTANDSDNYLVGTDDNDTIDGRGGNDTILGGLGNDQLLGGTGNDTLQGDAGNDTLTGGDGNDTLDGGTGNDRLTGGLGDDFYAVDSTDDVIQETDASGGLDSVSSAVSWTLGANLEELYLSWWSWDDVAGSWVEASINGTGNELDNYLSGNDANNILDGGAGNDRMYGEGGDDTLIGSGGDDRLYGDGGNDTLDGGTGNDLLSGGYGADTYLFGLGSGQDTIDSGLTYDGWYYPDVVGTIDRVVFGAGVSPDAVKMHRIGDDLVLTLSGSIEDRLTVQNYFLHDYQKIQQITFTGNSTVWDTAFIESHLETATEGDDVVTGSDGDDTIDGLGGNDTISGQSGADHLIGGAGDDELHGGAGNDTLDGGAGSDTLLGGAGDDTYGVDVTTDKVHETTTATSVDDAGGVDRVISTVSYTLGNFVENLTLAGTAANGTGNTLNNSLTGNDAANTLDGAGGNDELMGYGGDDTLIGGTGNDTMTGGTGNDTYRVDSTADVTTEASNLATEIDTVVTTVHWTLGPNIERLILDGSAAINGTGNALNNTLTGNAGNNSLAGLAGNDALNGAGGNDSLDGGVGADNMTGGTGNDTYYVDNTSDVTTETSTLATEIDTVVSTVSRTLGANIERLTLAGTAAINGTGNTLNNTLIGNAAANTLNGSSGADTMLGMAGNDTYYVDLATDRVYETTTTTGTVNAGGVDRVISTVSYTLGNFVENLTLAGTAAINGTGNALNNSLTGNAAANILNGGAGNDILDGAAGADTMLGMAGNDTYYVNIATDKVYETTTTTGTVNAGGVDRVISTASYTLGNFVENLTLAGTAAINGTGNALNNSLTGNAAANTLNGGAGNDILDGAAGADTMLGMAGNDTYYVNIATDRVYETTTTTGAINAGGVDRVISTVGYTLGNFVENLTLAGTAAINGTGNALNNSLTGNAAANTLNGAAGNDVLSGGVGNDLLIGSLGNDTLVGGAGKDIFLFDTTLNATNNKDSLTDFSVVDDTIRLDRTIFAKLTTLGTLNSAWFKASATGRAADSNDYLLYNTTTGALLYDQDATGAGAAVQFATLTAKPNLTAADFVVVA